MGPAGVDDPAPGQRGVHGFTPCFEIVLSPAVEAEVDGAPQRHRDLEQHGDTPRVVGGGQFKLFEVSRREPLCSDGTQLFLHFRGQDVRECVLQGFAPYANVLAGELDVDEVFFLVVQPQGDGELFDGPCFALPKNLLKSLGRACAFGGLSPQRHRHHHRACDGDGDWGQGPEPVSSGLALSQWRAFIEGEIA